MALSISVSSINGTPQHIFIERPKQSFCHFFRYETYMGFALLGVKGGQWRNFWEARAIALDGGVMFNWEEKTKLVWNTAYGPMDKRVKAQVIVDTLGFLSKNESWDKETKIKLRQHLSTHHESIEIEGLLASIDRLCILGASRFYSLRVLLANPYLIDTLRDGLA